MKDSESTASHDIIRMFCNNITIKSILISVFTLTADGIELVGDAAKYIEYIVIDEI